MAIVCMGGLGTRGLVKVSAGSSGKFLAPYGPCCKLLQASPPLLLLIFTSLPLPTSLFRFLSVCSTKQPVCSRVAYQPGRTMPPEPLDIGRRWPCCR